MTIPGNRSLFFWLVAAGALLFGTVQIFSSSPAQTPSSLIINEILVSNGSGLTDEDGDYSDWIELYNRGNQPVNLSGWALTDDLNQPQKWTLPNITLGSREYLVVFASGKDRSSAQDDTPLHTNFKLNRTGDALGLYNVLDGRFADTISPRLPKQFRDTAYGRFQDQPPAAESELSFGYLANPTPGGPNDESITWSGLVSGVGFSQPRGFFDEPFLLALEVAPPEATIMYTTDGSEPAAANGSVYREPIAITTTTPIRAIGLKPGFLPSTIATHTYIFLDDVLTQPPDPPGFPPSWGIYAKDYGIFKKGSPVIADYEMDPDVVNDPRYKDTIRDDLQSIPTLSIVTGIDNLDIYGQPRLRGPAVERPVSVEFIYPGNEPREGFQIDAGLRIQGGWGRWEFVPKHSFRLFFRRAYGASKLEYPLFPDSAVDEFNTLVLRAGVDESYAGKPAPGLDHRASTYTRDEWLRASQIAMSGIGAHGTFVHLYLNGLYWGLYNVVERPDASFTSAYLGGKKEDWFAIKHGSTVLGPDQTDDRGEFITGSGERFEALYTLASQGGLDDPDRYAAVQSLLDIPNFIDYLILAWYSGRESNWSESNWYAGVQNPDGQLKYFVWDGERSWYGGARVGFGRATELPSLIRQLFDALIQNPDFKMEVADRMYRHLFNDGALTDENARARWLKINRGIDRAIVGESARWGDTILEPPPTRDDWLKAGDSVLKQMEGNGDRLIALAREASYYPQLDPPGFSQSGGLVSPGFSLRLIAPQSQNTDRQTIYYTTNGSDPRLPVTAAVSDQALKYDAPLILTTTTKIKARAFAADPATGARTWSALNEATFRVSEHDRKLRITEIMYNPVGGDDYEFIELQNAGQDDMELANLFFEGIRFNFPPNSRPLAPGDFLVLVRNRAAFAERYPEVPVGGVYGGQLSNKGENIEIKDLRGRSVLQVDYDDENNWPISPDGRGDSLVLFQVSGDPADPGNWRASTSIHGSPGAKDPAQP